MSRILPDLDLTMTVPSAPSSPPPSLLIDGKKGKRKVVPAPDGASSSALESVGSRSLGCNVMSSSGTHERVIRKIYLRRFLRANGFREGDPHSARPGGCIFRRETVFPLHVAALQGDDEAVKMLLEEGVDIEKETSRGRTVMDCALAGNTSGSNERTLKLLQSWLKR